jgi:hypothetical protein
MSPDKDCAITKIVLVSLGIALANKNIPTRIIPIRSMSSVFGSIYWTSAFWILSKSATFSVRKININPKARESP